MLLFVVELYQSSTYYFAYYIIVLITVTYSLFGAPFFVSLSLFHFVFTPALSHRTDMTILCLSCDKTAANSLNSLHTIYIVSLHCVRQHIPGMFGFVCHHFVCHLLMSALCLSRALSQFTLERDFPVPFFARIAERHRKQNTYEMVW